MITVQTLQAHIDRLNAGKLDFSEVEMSLRADLVRFDGFSVEAAATIEEWEGYNIFDASDDSSEVFHVVTECKCDKCGTFLIETDYSDWDDKYTLSCPTCKTDIRIHYTSYDAWRDSIDEGKLVKA